MVAIAATAGRDKRRRPHRAQHALTPQVEQIAGRHDHGKPRHQQGNACAAHDAVEIEQPGQETSEQRRRDGEEIDEVARQRIDRRPVDDRRVPGIAGEPAGS